MAGTTESIPVEPAVFLTQKPPQAKQAAHSMKSEKEGSK